MPRSNDSSQPDLAAGQISRWADRIADGRDAFPADLAEPDRSRLADAIRWRLRNHLLRHVARAVAARLARGEVAAEDP